MARCSRCGKDSRLIAEALGFCCACLRDDFEDARAHVEATRSRIRAEFDLPTRAPATPGGVACSLCVHQCSMAPGEVSFCGLRRADDEGHLHGPSAGQGHFDWYHDPLPTNCVADWVCPGGTGTGYPEFAYSPGPERGYKNLAVFYRACGFDCLFCQNWHFRQDAGRARPAQELADAVDSRTSCICYFGGDPGAQLPHALRASRLARDKASGRILRICWETNGSMNPALADEMMSLALASGGCVKFDLKAWDEGLHVALTGVTNRRTLENFERLAARIAERPEPPPLVASTLLVPGYVDEREVAGIARFISRLNSDIPYALLGFHPDFYMHDLPPTSRRHAESCVRAAQDAGLKRVRIGNVHVLGADY
ncbi:MAG: radical SAM protein [Armatimonadota bacterium]|nr:MAG: radical SAM protein [Armatimonadota bacterium]